MEKTFIIAKALNVFLVLSFSDVKQVTKDEDSHTFKFIMNDGFEHSCQSYISVEGKIDIIRA